MTLIHGQDVNNNLVPLLLDPSGKVLIYGTLQVQLVAGVAVIGHVVVDSLPNVNANLLAGSNLVGKVDINSIPTTQVQSTQADKIPGYLSSLSAHNAPINMAAGTNFCTVYTVPANRAAVITNVSFYYTGTITNVVIAANVKISGIGAYVAYQHPVVSGQWYTFPVHCILGPADVVEIIISGATLNDTAGNSCCGYLMHNT